MKFGSLFSGIGGLDLGLERAGMECVWQVENDPYAIKVLEKHWPNIHREKDVREVGKHNLEPVDLIAGGFPCQPHSVAGKRRGADDDRNLWPEYMRIIRELRPRYVLAENVPGIVTTYIDTVLSDLESEGYTCWTFNIPACAFDAPHRRARIFIVAVSDSIRRGRWSNEDVSGQGGKIQTQGSSAAEEQGFLANPPIPNDRRSSPEPLRRSTQQSGIGTVKADVADTDSQYSQEYIRGNQLEEEVRERTSRRSDETQGGQWTTEPDVGRVAHGVPNWVDRLRCLGNAVVPQVAEWIGRRIYD